MNKRKDVVKEETPEVTVPASGSVSEASKVVETKEVHSCGECKFYDVSTQRDFHRDGIRKGLIECRAICRASKEHSTASGHLVKKESDRPCFERGLYFAPVKETNKTKTEQKQTEKVDAGQDAMVLAKTIQQEKTQPDMEKKLPTVKPRGAKHTSTAVAINGLSGQVSKLETRHGKIFVKNIA